MKQKQGIFNILGLIIIIVVLILVLNLFSVNPEKCSENIRTLTLKAEGQAKSFPDIGVVSVSIKTLDKNASKAQTHNAELFQNMKKELNNSVKKIESEAYNIYPDYDYIKYKKVFNGYKVVHTLKITADVQKLGLILDKLVSIGIVNIQNIYFELSKSKQKEAIQKSVQNAIENAKTKAETSAKAMGVKLLKIHSVDINGNPIINTYPVALRAAETSNIKDVEINPRELTLKTYINIVYEIK